MSTYKWAFRYVVMRSGGRRKHLFVLLLDLSLLVSCLWTVNFTGFSDCSLPLSWDKMT